MLDMAPFTSFRVTRSPAVSKRSSRQTSGRLWVREVAPTIPGCIHTATATVPKGEGSNIRSQ